MSEENEWAVSSGLPLADADVTITDFEFGYNPKIGDGLKLCANITFLVEESGETATQSFTTGDNWEAIEKGAAAEKNGGVGKQEFNKQSNFGRLVESVIALGIGAELGGVPRRASTWIGTKWHAGTTPVTTKNPTTGAESTKDAVIFTEYRGRDGAPAASNGSTTKAAGKGKQSAAIDPDIEAELIQLAQAAADHDEFMEKALDLDAVKNSKDLTNLVCESGKGSLWVRAISVNA